MPGRGFHPGRLIPLAFHVDYWDYLGWPDRFAQAQFSKRQRRVASLNGSRTVYTPQLVLLGQDFRGHSRLQTWVERINQIPARAQIALRVTPQSEALRIAAEAEVAETALRREAQVYVALYENNLQSDVAAGENAGRTLHHQFVVRQWIGPLALDAHGRFRWSESVALAKAWKRRDLGVVVCILDRRNGDTLQAVALSLHD